MAFSDPPGQVRESNQNDLPQRVEAEFRKTEKIDLSVGQVVGLISCAAAVFVSFAVAVTALLFWAPEYRLPVSILAAALALIAIANAAGIYFTSVDDRNARRRIWQQLAIEGTIDAGDRQSDPSLRDLLQLNRQEMTNYHELTKDQARRSFSNSLIAMWLGFLIVIACIVIISVPGLAGTDGKPTVAALGAVGTLVSGFITRTFLKQRTVSIHQLNRFFDQPLVTSYLLTAERLARQLEEPNRTSALESVIENALKAVNGERPPAEAAKTK